MSTIHPEHNTYLVTGERSQALALVLSAIETTLAIPIKGNPDMWHGTFSQFTIDDSRDLKAMLAMKPFGERRATVLEALLLTTEAQQAILKLTEELTANSFFFLLVPAHEHVLPTLRSRLIHVRPDANIATTQKTDSALLKAPWPEQQKAIEKIVKAKDQRGAYLLLEEFERSLRAAKNYDAISHIIEAKKRILSGVVPLKMTLETAVLLASRA